MAVRSQNLCETSSRETLTACFLCQVRHVRVRGLLHCETVQGEMRALARKFYEDMRTLQWFCNGLDMFGGKRGLCKREDDKVEGRRLAGRRCLYVKPFRCFFSRISSCQDLNPIGTLQVCLPHRPPALRTCVRRAAVFDVVPWGSPVASQCLCVC